MNGPVLRVLALAGGLTLAAGCSGGEPSLTPPSQTASSSTPSASSDTPIGRGGIDLGGSSPATSYRPDQLSGPAAADCHHAGTRIYDRHGLTCAEARAVLTSYDASAAGRKGQNRRIGRYDCSHNPSAMVVQGAAPGSCLDGTQAVAFNWRYPGAPQPARG